jgi:orotidine-5'-phosphate decarboxylase
MASFRERLRHVSEANRTLLCVGLDPDPASTAVPDVADFNRAIVDATADLVCAYKPNLAFYEALGSAGIVALEKTVAHIRERAPDVVVIADAKRGDMASSSARYARALFETWGFDAATVNGYQGGEALEPFLSYEDKGVFVLCKTSNPGASEFQDIVLASGRRLFEEVACRASKWNTRGNVGLVVGATYPDDLATVRGICPDMPVLLPGVGAQGGDLEASVRAGVDDDGRGLVVSSSRGVIYASREPADFATAARSAAVELRSRIAAVLEGIGKAW